MKNRGQLNTGIVTGLVGGVAFLIIGIIIAFVVVGTLEGSKIIPQAAYTATSESDSSGALVGANTSGYNVAGVAAKRNSGSFALTSCYAEYYQSNGTATTTTSFGGYNWSLGATNCTLSTTGNLSSGGATYNFPNVSVNYTYVGDGAEILTAGNMTSNFSTGVQSIATKIPTILLIASIVLILAVLAVLVAVWQRIRMGSGNL